MPRSRMSARTCSTSSPSSFSTRDARGPSRARGRPRATSSRVTCDPTRPVAPVTRVSPTAGSVVGRSGDASRRGASLGGTSRVRRCPARRRRHRHHALPPARAGAGAGDPEVSLYVNQGGTITKESDMPDFDAFYDGLRTAAELPTTSQPSIGDFLEVYEPLLDDGRDVVSVHLSAGISGTCESARQAAAELDGQRTVHVVDSARPAGARRCASWPRWPPRVAASTPPGSPSTWRTPRRARDVVRRGHARVPAEGRAHRVGSGVAGFGAQDQADPRARGRRSPRSSGSAPPAAPSSGWWTS